MLSIHILIDSSKKEIVVKQSHRLITGLVAGGTSGAPRITDSLSITLIPAIKKVSLQTSSLASSNHSLEHYSQWPLMRKTVPLSGILRRVVSKKSISICIGEKF